MLQIYGSPFSAPSNKIRYVVNYLNIPHEFHRINLSAGEQRTPEYLKINPYGKIPAIDDDGFKLAESNAIIRYLASKHHSLLYPQNLEQRAIVDQWMDYAAMHVGMATSKIMFNTYFYKLSGVTQDERSLREGRKFLNSYLPVIEQQLAKHAYITGSTITLADMALLAALDACELIEVQLSSYARIDAWRKKLMQEKFFTKCHESYAIAFKQMMEKIINKVTN